VGAPDRGPLPPEQDDAERERRLRRAWGLAQAGVAVFLAVVAIGLVPTVLTYWFPALGARAWVLAMIVAPAVAVAFVVVAALRLRR
jgi:precorrin isomerase